MSANNNYRLQLSDLFLAHGHHQLGDSLLRDTTQDWGEMELDALVASGDCFVTLATLLDLVDHNLQASGTPEQPELEKAIRSLLYLQRHYSLSKKRPNYRQ